MSMVVDIHKRRKRSPDYDIYIGRKVRYHPLYREDSKWANRFTTLELYEAHVRQNLWDDLDELKGKVLGCWCVTTSDFYPVRCHGQVLMRLLKEKESRE